MNYEHLRFVGSDGRILFHGVLRWQTLQVKERRDRVTRKAMESLKRREPAEPATYGTIFGGPTLYERRSKIF